MRPQPTPLALYHSLDERAARHAARLDELNARFYEAFASTFHQTRGFGWRGWRGVLDLAPRRPLTVYDLGCGNGRLTELLSLVWCAEWGEQMKRYVGLDRDLELLSYAEARETAWESQWGEWSWSTQTTRPADSATLSIPLHLEVMGADWVTLFGVMHHIYSASARAELMSWASQHVAIDGVLSVSLWDFGAQERYQKKRLDWSSLHPPCDEELIEEGDWLLGWRGDRATPRFCHWMSRDEEQVWLDEVARRAPHLSAPMLTTHPHDGNRYWSWRRLR